MKFAVKTVTCMGCKTPLKATNSVKSASIGDVTQRSYSSTDTQMELFVTIVGRVLASSTRNRQISKSLFAVSDDN